MLFSYNFNTLLCLVAVLCFSPTLITRASGNPVETSVPDWAKTEDKYSAWLQALNDPKNKVYSALINGQLGTFTFFIPINAAVPPDSDNSWLASHLGKHIPSA